MLASQSSSLEGQPLSIAVSEALSETFETMLRTMMTQTGRLINQEINTLKMENANFNRQVIKLIEGHSHTLSKFPKEMDMYNIAITGFTESQGKSKDIIEQSLAKQKELETQLLQLKRIIEEGKSRSDISLENLEPKLRTEILDLIALRLEHNSQHHDGTEVQDLVTNNKSLIEENLRLREKVNELEEKTLKAERKASKRKNDIRLILSYLEKLTMRVDELENMASK